MGSYLHRAIGYALSIEDFKRYCPLDLDGDDDMLDVVAEHFLKVAGHGPHHYGGMLKGYELGTETTFLSKMGNIHRLIHVVGTYDNPEHLLFIPTEAMAKVWHRFNDIVDWTFGLTFDRDDPFTSVIEYLPPSHNFSPFYRERMDRNGVRVIGAEDADDDTLAAGVPDILRWWLTQYNILSMPGVGRLRPMRAQWWG